MAAQVRSSFGRVGPEVRSGQTGTPTVWPRHWSGSKSYFGRGRIVKKLISFVFFDFAKCPTPTPTLRSSCRPVSNPNSNFAKANWCVNVQLISYFSLTQNLFEKLFKSYLEKYPILGDRRMKRNHKARRRAPRGQEGAARDGAPPDGGA